MRAFLPFVLALYAGLAQGPALFGQHPVIQGIVNGIQADSMMWNLERLSGEEPVNVGAGSQTIVSRNKFNPGNALAADWLQQRLSDYGYSPTVQTFSGSTGENVLAAKTGALHPARKVIVCGHYDAMPASPAAAPAADDDGSGTVAVLEAARLFASLTFENTVVFALWDEEEQGLVGSDFYAGVAASNDDSIIAVINMDAISFDGDGDGLMRVHTKPIASSIAIKDTAVMVNTLYGIDQPMAINNPGATYSDHASFWSEGFGAILVIEDFDNDGNPHYHTPTDLVQYIDVPYFAQLTRIALATAAAWAIPHEGTIDVEEIAVTPRSGLHVFPNPADDHAQVWCDEGRLRTLWIVDATGRVLQVLRPGDVNAMLDVSSLMPAAYMLRAEMTNGGVAAVRLIVH